MIFGYARVSTDGQSVDAQVKALCAAGAEKVFRETASAAKTDRAQIGHAIAALGNAGAGFRSLADASVDTTIPHGRLMLTVLGGLAEFERKLIRARTGEGRRRAKARGVHMGRPPVLTRHRREEALAALAEGGATQADLTRRFNVNRCTISRLQ
jgi:DNA invertase Pin-like site-specific DNA recombinase